MKFYRVRKNWAWGSSRWEYFVENGYPSDELAEEIHSLHGYSDKYRGCDIERDVIPPKEWLEKCLDDARSSAKFYQKREKELEEFIKNYENEHSTNTPSV